MSKVVNYAKTAITVGNIEVPSSATVADVINRLEAAGKLTANKGGISVIKSGGRGTVCGSRIREYVLQDGDTISIHTVRTLPASTDEASVRTALKPLEPKCHAPSEACTCKSCVCQEKIHTITVAFVR